MSEGGLSPARTCCVTWDKLLLLSGLVSPLSTKGLESDGLYRPPLKGLRQNPL